MSIFGRLRGYCPHPPLQNPHQHPLYYNTAWLSFKVQDFSSSLDGLVGFAILFGLLFLASFLVLPNAGVVEQYQLALLRVGSAAFASLALVYLYAKSRGIRFLSLRVSTARQSVLESLLAVLVWGGLWIMFGAISHSYFVNHDSKFLLAAPFALFAGLLSGLVAYGYCAPKFQQGLGKLLGVIISTSVGALLFFAVSVDYPLTFIPLILLLVYVGVRTNSPIGQIIFSTLLFGLFYVWPVAPSLMSSMQPVYGSIGAAIPAGLLLRWVPPQPNEGTR